MSRSRKWCMLCGKPVPLRMETHDVQIADYLAWRPPAGHVVVSRRVWFTTRYRVNTWDCKSYWFGGFFHSYKCAATWAIKKAGEGVR